MTILAQRLDDKIEAGARRVVTHPSRVKTYSADGKLAQSFPSSRLKHSFDVSHGVRSQADYMTVIGAFYTVMGTPYSGMLFKDWADYIATRTNTSVTSLGAGVYQLNRIYAFGAYTYTRKITRPLTGAAVYNAGGTPLTPTIDLTNGTFTVASGTPNDWSGEFVVPVTFADNEWQASLEVSTQNLHLVHESIMLEEVFE
jgi:uncharacterized protein (TIGR02217 family)